MEMNPTERLKLQEMIKANNVEDQTNRIRELKHSQLIRQDISTYLQLTQKYPGSHTKEFFKQTCLKNCNFLFTNYTDIYNKMITKIVYIITRITHIYIIQKHLQICLYNQLV